MPELPIKKSEYILFIYLCMAKADNDINLLEVDMLFDKLDLIFFDNPNSHELLVSVAYKRYIQLKPEDRKLLIKSHAKEHLGTKVEALNLLNNLTQLIGADGRIDDSETLLFDELKEIFSKTNF